MVGLADLIAIFHDSSCLTIKYITIFGHGDLVYVGCFGE